jgi:ATP-binding protein involved in chromosome partitioning
LRGGNTLKLQDIKEKARVLVTAACRTHAIEESTFPSESRLLDVLSERNVLRIDIASDDMVLSQKMAMERFLLQNLPASNAEGCEYRVYFRRLRAAADGTLGNSAGPVPTINRISPFGLQPKRKAIPGVAKVIVVASGKGGVGKSTVSTNLAVALANRFHKNVGLLDADVYGPSAPTMLGTLGSMNVTATGKIEPLVAHRVKCVSFGFMSDAFSPVMWRGPMVGKAINQFCYDVDWGDLDFLIVDLPPGTGDVQLSLIETLPIAAAIIVTTPQDVALIDAHKALSMFEKLQIPVAGVVENMSFHVCNNCGHEEHIFGEDGVHEFSLDRNLPILAKFPIRKEIRERSDIGVPIALDEKGSTAEEFARLAGVVLELN